MQSVSVSVLAFVSQSLRNLGNLGYRSQLKNLLFICLQRVSFWRYSRLSNDVVVKLPEVASFGTLRFREGIPQTLDVYFRIWPTSQHLAKCGWLACSVIPCKQVGNDRESEVKTALIFLPLCAKIHQILSECRRSFGVRGLQIFIPNQWFLQWLCHLGHFKNW